MSLENKIVWMVLYTQDSIELCGIFDTEDKAKSVCEEGSEYYVIVPVVINEDYTDIKDLGNSYRPSGAPLYNKGACCENK